MKTPMLEKGPVIIGGIGGSGTRVLTEIVTLFGFFMGKDLNVASDNLTYTLLFKRPEWFKKNFKNTRRLITGLRIMEKCMVTGNPLSFRERIFLRKAVSGMSKYGHNKDKQGTGDWPNKRAAFINNPEKPDMESYKGWGWKEPNSHLMLPVFNEYFPNLRYIHTIRHGLDMAYSDNQQQLYNWASLFGLDIPKTPDEIPGASFRYWHEANKKVISFGKELGDRKFLLVNFDEMCQYPLSAVKRIADFLQISPSEELLLKASKLPEIPKSTGRYKGHLENIFDPKDLSFLEELGFSYD